MNETVKDVGTMLAVLLSALAAAGSAIQAGVNGQRADETQATLDVKREEWDRARDRMLDVYYQRNQEIYEIQVAIAELRAKVGITSPPLKPRTSEDQLDDRYPSGRHPRYDRDYH